MFLIAWTAEAFEQMTGIVLRHAHRKSEIGAVLREITGRLHDDPAAVGESRDDEYRVTHVRPLTVYFKVDEASKVVEVTRVVFAG